MSEAKTVEGLSALVDAFGKAVEMHVHRVCCGPAFEINTDADAERDVAEMNECDARTNACKAAIEAYAKDLVRQSSDQGAALQRLSDAGQEIER